MTSGGDDELWQEIVDNYGDRPDFPEPPVPERTLPAELDESRDHYVPPVPPPAPLPTGWRGVAWLGVLGVPLLTLLLAILPFSYPSFVWMLLIAWFAGGFVYLVATMSRGPEDGWDDGTAV